MADTLHVEIRQQLGSLASRRLRRAGQVPLVLYGHGKGTLHLAAPAEEIAAIMRHGSKMVELRGSLKENAFLKEVQWDPFGIEVLHVDLTRLIRGERVEVALPLRMVGESPGAKDGGIVDQLVHDIEIDCPAHLIPEYLELRINELQLNQSLTAGNIELPAEAKLVTPDETVVVNCYEAAPELEEEEEVAAGEGTEPEVIGRKEEEEESED